MDKIKEIYNKYQEIINYIIVGVLTTIVSLAAYYASTRTFLDPSNAFQLQIANLIKWTVGVLFAYVTNRKYVFKSKSDNIAKEFTSFVSSRFATLFLDMAIMALLVTGLKINDLVSNIISIGLVTIANYFLSKIFVFKNQ